METVDISVRFAVELKQTNMNEFGEYAVKDSDETNTTETDNTETYTNNEETGTVSAQTETSHHAADDESHDYRKKLRSHRKQVLPLICTNELSLETEFYEYVEEILNELNIDCYSFYR